jgi:hypothetical protein
VNAPDWVLRNPKKAARVGERILEGLREVGVLLVAFAPLDMAIGEKPLADSWPILVMFFLAGLTMFVMALILEWRRDNIE